MIVVYMIHIYALVLSLDSQCDTMENKCACLPDYYQTEGSRICGM